MLQNKISDNNLKQPTGDMEGSFYVICCAIGTIFEVEDKISTTKMKFLLKGCCWVRHITSTPDNSYFCLYHKKATKINNLDPGNNLLGNTPNLGTHPNGTRRRFPPIFLSKTSNI